MLRSPFIMITFLSVLVAIYFIYHFHSRTFIVEESCLVPQEITIEQLFSGQTTYIWKLGDYNGDDDLIAQGIVGYLTPHYIGTNDKVDKQATAVKITGRVFKITPSWAEINIGQSEKQLALEVIVLGERYLLFEPEWKRQYFNKLPKRCIFENHED